MYIGCPLLPTRTRTRLSPESRMNADRRVRPIEPLVFFAATFAGGEEGTGVAEVLGRLAPGGDAFSFDKARS